MRNPLYLATQYLRYNWGKSMILILSIGLIVFIPLGLNFLAEKGARQLTARAESTPLLVGTMGSQTELALSALYFKMPVYKPLSFSEMESIAIHDGVQAIPLHLRFGVGSNPIAGTTSDYFDFRGLDLAEGRRMALLGECVLGSAASEDLNAGVGQTVTSSPVTAFDIAGSFPLRMQVVGVLAPAGTADDNAVFTDVKTTWVIEGLAHGHQDVTEATADSLLMSRDSAGAVASPAVLSYTEITPENRSSFHFHGDPASYPIDAIIAIPEDKRASLMLRGYYENERDDVQIAVPRDVIKELVGTLFNVRDLLFLAALSIGIATAVIIALVFMLSIRLRRREISTMYKMGGSRGRIRQMLGMEIVMVAVSGVVVAVLMTLAVNRFGLQLIEQLIM
jgi:putative ABC transport system permease protein